MSLIATWVSDNFSPVIISTYILYPMWKNNFDEKVKVFFEENKKNYPPTTFVIEFTDRREHGNTDVWTGHNFSLAIT